MKHLLAFGYADKASLIHDLAIQGAERLERQAADQQRLLDELADPNLTASRLSADALQEVLALRAASPCSFDTE